MYLKAFKLLCSDIRQRIAIHKDLTNSSTLLVSYGLNSIGSENVASNHAEKNELSISTYSRYIYDLTVANNVREILEEHLSGKGIHEEVVYLVSIDIDTSLYSVFNDLYLKYSKSSKKISVIVCIPTAVECYEQYLSISRTLKSQCSVTPLFELATLFIVTKDNVEYAPDIYEILLESENLHYIAPGLEFIKKCSEIDDRACQREQLFDAKMFFFQVSKNKNSAFVDRLAWQSYVADYNNCEVQSYLKKYLVFNQNNIIADNSKCSNIVSYASSTYANLYLDSFKKTILPRQIVSGHTSTTLSVNTIASLIGRYTLSKLPKKPLHHDTPKIASNRNSFNGLSSLNSILITGCFGTETNGDKAILGELLHIVKKEAPSCMIYVTSIHRVVSEQSRRELPLLRDAKFVSLSDAVKESFIKKIDAVIIGGGPLMDSSTLASVLNLFHVSRRNNKSNLIFGSGIGPLNKESSVDQVREIIKLTDAGFLRDVESLNYSKNLVPENCLKLGCDPAFGYIVRQRKKLELNRIDLQSGLARSKPIISSLLRSSTKEFISSNSDSVIVDMNAEFCTNVSKAFKLFSDDTPCKYQFLQMNAHHIGGDDRRTNEHIYSGLHLQDPDNQHVNVRSYLTLDDQIELLSTSEMSIAMRYHGHIFSMALGVPFVSVDYTSEKGKVANLIKRFNYEKHSVEWPSVNASELVGVMNSVYQDKSEISSNLIDKSDSFSELLDEVYVSSLGCTPISVGSN